jgi:hypothetical protein
MIQLQSPALVAALMRRVICNGPSLPWCFMFQTAGEYDILSILIAHT